MVSRLQHRATNWSNWNNELHRLCQHRWPAIAGMVGFRNNVGSAPLTGWVSPSSQQIAFSRGTSIHTFYFLCRGERSHAQGIKGSLGFVAINNMDSAWSATFETGLPAGSYCNVIDGPFSKGVCSGGTAYVERERGCHKRDNLPIFGFRFADSRSDTVAA